jgi:hypothetical protein
VSIQFALSTEVRKLQVQQCFVVRGTRGDLALERKWHAAGNIDDEISLRYQRKKYSRQYKRVGL